MLQAIAPQKALARLVFAIVLGALPGAATAQGGGKCREFCCGESHAECCAKVKTRMAQLCRVPDDRCGPDCLDTGRNRIKKASDYWMQKGCSTGGEPLSCGAVASMQTTADCDRLQSRMQTLCTNYYNNCDTECQAEVRQRIKVVLNAWKGAPQCSASGPPPACGEPPKAAPKSQPNASIPALPGTQGSSPRQGWNGGRNDRTARHD